MAERIAAFFMQATAFFMQATAVEGKDVKVLGWKGPSEALALIGGR